MELLFDFIESKLKCDIPNNSSNSSLLIVDPLLINSLFSISNVFSLVE